MLCKTILLFFITALTKIAGCFLPYYWLRKGGSVWLLIPAAISLATFTWLLTIHLAASGRVYAAYGCVYMVTALLWLRIVDGISLTISDITGGTVALIGMPIIINGWVK